MKTKLHFPLILLMFFAVVHQVAAQGTAFTYQGQLQNNGAPANGSYDLQFALFTTNQFGSPTTPVLTNAAVTVNNGLFTTTLDFGAGVFNGTNYWLDISVRTNGGGTFAELSPRQSITPTPYAVFANNVNGLIIQANASGAPNVIGGSPNNFVAGGVVGATIAGGGATNTPDIIPSSATNSVTADFGTVSGGADNTASGEFATVGGGGINTASERFATVGGGAKNTASDDSATVGGGQSNTASGELATVGGGFINTASGQFATVGGGAGNTASNTDATVSGGGNNTASGLSATVGGGAGNTASGNFSFAAGREAQATNNGTFVWADSQGAPFSSTATNQFLIRASGGVGINTASPQQALSVVGGVNVDQNGQNDSGNVNNNGLTFGSGSGEGIASQRTGTGNVFDLVLCTRFLPRLTVLQNGFVGVGVTPTTSFQVGLATCNGLMWTSSSDRNLKEDFTAINPRAVLEKISAMPITEWKYKVEAHGTQHIGPMAQDFHAAFGLDGADDKHISTIDEGGVALAAIQGLNQKLDEKDSEIQTLKQQNDSLAARLNELEMTVKQLTAQK